MLKKAGRINHHTKLGRAVLSTGFLARQFLASARRLDRRSNSDVAPNLTATRRPTAAGKIVASIPRPRESRSAPRAEREARKRSRQAVARVPSVRSPRARTTAGTESNNAAHSRAREP